MHVDVILYNKIIECAEKIKTHESVNDYLMIITLGLQIGEKS